MSPSKWARRQVHRELEARIRDDAKSKGTKGTEDEQKSTDEARPKTQKEERDLRATTVDRARETPGKVTDKTERRQDLGDPHEP